MAISPLHSQTRQGKPSEPVGFAARMLERALRRWRREEADAVRYAVAVIRQHNLASLVDALPSAFAERVRAAVDNAIDNNNRRREERERQWKAQREEQALRLTPTRAGIAGLQGSRKEEAKQFIGTIGLRERGWTAAQIVRLLGAPDATRTNPHGADLSPMKLFRRDRVAEVERSAAFAEWRENAKRRAQGSLVEPTAENILAAIFAVNRGAKRRRDAASIAYGNGMHGFAGLHSSEKHDLYRLKDKGIVHLASESVLICIGIHGRLALWKGGGYTFHSTLHPLPLPETIEGDLFLAEAKPRARREPRIKDARLLLESLGDQSSRFGRLNSVSYASRRVRFKEDFIEEDFIEDFIEEEEEPLEA